MDEQTVETGITLYKALAYYGLPLLLAAIILTVVTGNKWIKVIILIMSLLLAAIRDETCRLGRLIYTTIFGPVPILNQYNVQVNPEIINTRGNIPHCPNLITVQRLGNQTLKVVFNSVPERTQLVRFRGVTFEIGRAHGRVKNVVIDYPYIRNRGVFLRQGCGETEWRQFISSVVQAHLEVLKFYLPQHKRTRHPILVSRIFRNYADPIFQEVA